MRGAFEKYKWKLTQGTAGVLKRAGVPVLSQFRFAEEQAYAPAQFVDAARIMRGVNITAGMRRDIITSFLEGSADVVLFVEAGKALMRARGRGRRFTKDNIEELWNASLNMFRNL